ncbi:PAS domain-containing protein [Marinibaculum pumilum]|uniref:PAS domain-containing protein n=1 Tax=Marinibaculum pumilum TaxID=1766165 RepID=A0ABV7L371_9PROT
MGRRAAPVRRGIPGQPDRGPARSWHRRRCRARCCSVPLDLSGVSDPRLVRAFDYWDRIRGDRRMPSRRDIQPKDIKALLPHVFLVDVLRHPPRFRIRLAGTEVNNRFGTDLTGRFLDELDLGSRQQAILAAYAATVDAGEPSLDSEEYLRRDGRPLRYRRLLCPLSSDGRTVDMLFGVLAGLPSAPSGQPE